MADLRSFKEKKDVLSFYLFIYFCLKKAKILCCLEQVKAKRVPPEIIFKV